MLGGGVDAEMLLHPRAHPGRECLDEEPAAVSNKEDDVEVDLLVGIVEVVVADSVHRVPDGLDDGWEWKLHPTVALRVADEVVGVAAHKHEAAMRGDGLRIQQTECLLEQVRRPRRASTWLEVDGAGLLVLHRQVEEDVLPGVVVDLDECDVGIARVAASATEVGRLDQGSK